MRPPADPGFSVAGALALDALAARIAAELDGLAQLSGEVQLALSLCHFAEHTDPAAIRGLQRLDRITQALEDLGRLMAALSREIPQELQADSRPLLSQLRLQGLIHALARPGPAAAAPHAEPPAAPPIEDGDVQWF